MSRTVTALFDTRADAEAGRARLTAANCDVSNVHIHDQSSMDASYSGSSTSGSGSMTGTGMSNTSASTGSTSGTSAYSSSQEPGIWSSIKNAFLPDEDRHTYEEGIRRGGFLLTADVDEDEVEGAVRALEDANGVDIDQRSSEWRSGGWAGPAAGAATGGAMFGSTPDRDRDRTTDTSRATGTDAEQVIPVVEEQLVVGKRETERGGVRVRSYVTEKPMHEQIRLRQERVEVERRPVDQPLSAVDGDAFRERTVEMTETNEEAVVSKNARVVEEVVVHKNAGERVEDVNETVRRTDVDVEQLSDTDRRTTGYAGTSGSTGTAGSSVGGMANEAIGNVKQGLGSLTGSESLEQSGEAQERRGESQQGKTPGS